MSGQIFLQSISSDALIEAIRTVVREEIQSPAEPVRAESSTKFLSRKEAAGQLHVTLATLAAWTKSGKLKAHRIGRRVLYKAADLEAALKPMKLK